MESSSCNIELKIMYARDLVAFNFFQKLNVYVVVSIINKEHPEKELVKEQRTPADKEGDGNPEWNHEMRFDLNNHDWLEDYKDLFLSFSFKHEGVMFGDKDIGEVHVPFSDLIQEFNGILRFVNYEIRSPDGKPNGMLNFSYKVNGKCKDQKFGIGLNSGHITGYQHHHHHHDHHHHNHHHSSPEKINYPSLHLEETSTTLYPVPQQDYSMPVQHHHQSHEIYPPPAQHHHQSHETYPPPGQQPFLPPPPRPPPEHLMFPHNPLLPPPPPAMSHEVGYYPPYRPPSPRAYPWGAPNPYDYGTYRPHHGHY